MSEDLWHTADGHLLYAFEMSDAHLQNAKTLLERRIAAGEYRRPHSCPVDISDGPCLGCEADTSRHIAWEDWVVRFDKEIRRRAAEASRQATPTP